MASDLKRSYKFAFITSITTSLFFSVLAGVLFYVQLGRLPWIAFFVLFILTLLFSFIVIQQRIERFIYKRIKDIYDNVSLLDATNLNPNRVSTDMTTLTREVEKFAADKKIEIEKLQVREAYRKELLGNIAHELKTPLFTVQGYILTLIDGAHKDKAIRKKYLQRASKGVDRLIYIVKDLDMITKLETSDLTVYQEVFNIVELINSVFDLYEMKASKKNITLMFDRNYEEPIWVFADEEKVQQVLSNLVVNSIKYGKKDGTTEVSIEDLTSDKVIVRVTDNGEGIANSNIPRLFERFYRVDKSGSRREGGSGLGLAIVKHIIEAHNEKIYVESVLGVGSEFSFTLEKDKEVTPVDVPSVTT